MSTRLAGTDLLLVATPPRQRRSYKMMVCFTRYYRFREADLRAAAVRSNTSPCKCSRADNGKRLEEMQQVLDVMLGYDLMLEWRIWQTQVNLIITGSKGIC